MSRVILSKYDDGSDRLVVGWDHPAGGAFWQEWASKSEVAAAEALMTKAEKTGIGPHSETVQIVETGVKREGGMWPGIQLANLRASMPDELASLVTDQVMELLEVHSQDPDSGYRRSTSLVDWTVEDERGLRMAEAQSYVH